MIFPNFIEFLKSKSRFIHVLMCPWICMARRLGTTSPSQCTCGTIKGSVHMATLRALVPMEWAHKISLIAMCHMELPRASNIVEHAIIRINYLDQALYTKFSLSSHGESQCNTWHNFVCSTLIEVYLMARA